MGMAGTASSGYSSALIFVQTSFLFLVLLDILSFTAISSLGFHDPASGPLHMVARLFTTQRHLADGVTGGSNPTYCVHQVVCLAQAVSAQRKGRLLLTWPKAL